MPANLKTILAGSVETGLRRVLASGAIETAILRNARALAASGKAQTALGLVTIVYGYRAKRRRDRTKRLERIEETVMEIKDEIDEEGV